MSNILLLAASTVSAATISLDFNNLQIGEEVLGYYSGGFGSLGSGRGPNLGVTFTSGFVTVGQGVFGPPFRGEELTGPSGIMDVVSDFSAPFSFYYINAGATGSVSLYSGLDGSGSLLETITLPPSAIFNTIGVFEAQLPFKSAVFTGSAGALVFDNITFGNLVLPEPSSMSLLLIALPIVRLRARKSIATGGGRG